jgi:hypothetical protein
MPLQIMRDVLVNLIQKDPLALLCQREGCDRCDVVRQAASLRQQAED